MNRELKVYFHTDQKRTRRKKTSKLHAFSDTAAFFAVKDLVKNKKDFAQLQQLFWPKIKKPGNADLALNLNYSRK
ncbi:hypothetical protein L0337_14240 [candidate division KSB1 bacterium]|nr:hypothetical protein [candidate division KSB1 bacterium]